MTLRLYLIYDKKALPNFNFGSFSKKKLLLLGFLFAVLLVIPLTVYLVGQQQETRTRAEKSTTLSFSPSEDTATVGGTLNLNIFVHPGTNQINYIKLVLKYDATKLAATEESFTLNPASDFSILQDPAIGPNGDEFSITLEMTDSTKVITQDTRIGSVSFEAISSSETPTQISFDKNQIQVRGIEGDFTENVYQNGNPASITIQGGEVSPTPTPTLTPRASLSPSPTSTESGDGTTPAENQVPVCESLNTDRATTGNPPLSLTFTANGSDSDGTISKVTFNFGDGPVETETTGGGLGTGSVSLEKSHTYQNSGTFTASAVLTDDTNGTSDTTNCTVTITVSGGSGSSNVTPIPPTGPDKTIVGVGVLGGILFIIGALLFFAL